MLHRRRAAQSASVNKPFSSHQARVDLAEARRAEDVEQQLLLSAGAHPQEDVQPRLQEVDSAFRQPLLRGPHCHWQRAALKLCLKVQY